MNHRGQKSGSIFGGLLLVVIGVLFLIHSLRPDWLRLGEIARYWPVLLILWGLARLWEYFAAKRSGQQSARTVTGGDLLVVLLVVIGVAALAAHDRFHRGGWVWDTEIGLFGNSYTFTDALPAQTAPPAAHVDFWTPHGDIAIQPQQAPGLNVVLSKTIDAANQADAQRIAASTIVTFETTAQGLRLAPKMPFRDNNERVSYDVRVFPNASVSASTGRGTVHIEGIQGTVFANVSGQADIADTSSDTTVHLSRGDVRIHSAGGNVWVDGHGEQVDIGGVAGGASIDGEFYGPIHVRAVAHTFQFRSARTSLAISALPGRLELDSDRLVLADTPGDLVLKTRDKDVDLENVQGRLRIDDHNGDVEVRISQPPRNDININTNSGDIELALPDDSACSISAFTRSGDISTDFETPALQLTEESQHHRLEGTLGSGGPKISLNTNYGDIRIRKLAPAPGVAPSPPLPPPPR
jgi:hypothetical protein